jgi:hypothetical protein
MLDAWYTDSKPSAGLKRRVICGVESRLGLSKKVHISSHMKRLTLPKLDVNKRLKAALQPAATGCLAKPLSDAKGDVQLRSERRG